MRTNKWSATIALLTLLVTGTSAAESSKARSAKAGAPDRAVCERTSCDCHLDNKKGRQNGGQS